MRGPFRFSIFLPKNTKKYFGLIFGYVPNCACTIYSWQLFFDWKPRSAITQGANPKIKKGDPYNIKYFYKKKKKNILLYFLFIYLIFHAQFILFNYFLIENPDLQYFPTRR